MEGVDRAVGGHFPTGGEARNDPGVRGEAGEAVEEVADDPAGGNVGGEGRVEGAGIVVVARVNEGASIGASAAPTTGQEKGREQESEATAHDVLA